MNSNNKNILILLTNTGTVLSRIIKKYTKEPYTHVSIGLDIELNELYSFGRKRPYNPLIGGFVNEDIKNGTYARFIDTTCAVYTLKVTEKQYTQLKKVISEFEENGDKYRYNFIGLFGAAAKIPIERENAYFCSQFTAKVLQKSGINIFRKRPGLVTPSDFRTCKHLNLVYRGKLFNYDMEFPSEKVI